MTQGVTEIWLYNLNLIHTTCRWDWLYWSCVWYLSLRQLSIRFGAIICVIIRLSASNWNPWLDGWSDHDGGVDVNNKRRVTAAQTSKWKWVNFEESQSDVIYDISWRRGVNMLEIMLTYTIYIPPNDSIQNPNIPFLVELIRISCKWQWFEKWKQSCFNHVSALWNRWWKKKKIYRNMVERSEEFDRDIKLFFSFGYGRIDTEILDALCLHG